MSLETCCNEGLTLILYARKAGSINLVMLLLDMDPNVYAHAEEPQHQAIHLAAESGSVEVCCFLQAKGLAINNLDAAGNTPLAVACWEGHLEVVQFLLATRATLGLHILYHTGMLLLCVAVMKSHGHIAELLLNVGGSPSDPDGQGWYAPIYTAHHSHPFSAPCYRAATSL